MTGFADTVAGLCTTAEQSIPAPELAGQAGALGARLAGPLRVAIAGRVKAGKSTLLNALVEQRVAPTDAGECTRIVTTYAYGPTVRARLILRDGGLRVATFTRDERNLAIDLGSLSADEVERIEVTYPAPALSTVALIDTPGLGSLDESTSRRTEAFLEATDHHGPDADAVIYLMRHVHERDVAFLDSFMDSSVSSASPINAIGVLSRADEVGAGRLDAMASAERVAHRYRTATDVRSLCSTVVPVAGLIAETAATLREDEVAALRTLAAMSTDEVAALLVTADRFRDVSRTTLTAGSREALLGRLGMFGVRFAIDTLARDPGLSSEGLATALLERSGVAGLRAVLAEQFVPRARVLQARSALAGLRALVPRVTSASPEHGRWLAACVDQIEATAHELAELRALHLVLSDGVRLRDDEVGEVRRLTLATTVEERLAVEPGATAEERRARSLEAVSRWRTRGADPLADPATTQVCDTMARSFEIIYATSGAAVSAF